MLIILIQWCIISFLASVWGASFYHLTLSKPTLTKEEISCSPSKIVLFLAGLAGIAWTANLLSLFWPITGYIWGVLVLPLIGCTLFKRSLLKTLLSKRSSINCWVLIPLTLISLNLVGGITDNVDEAGYYLPLVKWIESYKVIPGSALLIARTGFNSSLHMLNAVFGGNSIYPSGIYELNGCLFIWFNYYFVTRSLTLLKVIKSSIPRLHQVLPLAALVFPFSFLVDSMDTDYLVIMGGIVIFTEVLKLRYKNKIQSAETALLFLIGLLLATTKVFAVFILALPLFILKPRKRIIQLVLFYALAALVYLMPWLIRNVISTGYLVFPIYFLDLFNVDWKVPSEMTKASYLIVEEFAKIEKIRSSYELTGVQDLKLSEWLPSWLKNIRQYLIGKVSLLVLPLTFIGWTYALLTKKHLNYKFEFKLMTYILLVLAYWFLNIPAIRFGWYWIISGSILAFYLVIDRRPLLMRILVTALLIVVSLSWTRLAIHQLTNINNTKELLIISRKTITEIPFHNDQTTPTVRISETEFCHGLRPPCKPFNNNYKVVARGKTIESGFMIKEMSK